MKWAIQAKEEEKNKPQTFSADGWTGNQRSSQMWWRNEQELPSPEPRTARTSELNGSGGGGGRAKGIRGPRNFVSVGGSNRDQRIPFCPGWWLQPGQKGILWSLAPHPASRWTRDKSLVWSRAQRRPGQMRRIKGLFYSSDATPWQLELCWGVPIPISKPYTQLICIGYGYKSCYLLNCYPF